MPLPKEELHAFEIVNWQGKTPEEIKLDSSSGIIEASKTPLGQRINPVAIKLERFSQWADKDSLDPIIMASTRIYEWASEPNRKAIEIGLPSQEPGENEILETLEQWPDSNPQELMVWISPRNNSTFKEGTRVGIYQVILIGGEKYLFFRTLCSYIKAEDCAKEAQGLLNFSTLKVDPATFFDPEILRSTPLPLKVPGNSLTAFLKRHLNLPNDVWEAIAQGKDLAEKIKINQTMKELYTPQVLQQISQAKTWSQQAQIGIYLEREFQRRTGRELVAGSCGGLYSEVSFSPLGGALGIGISPKNHINPSEGPRKFIHNCGACGRELKRYMSKGDRCPYCGGIYEGC